MSHYGYICHSELYHHGIKGMKWGIRRYQNKDGTLTPEGKRRYGTVENLNKAISRKKKIALGIGLTTAAAAAIGAGAYGIEKTIRNRKEINNQYSKRQQHTNNTQESIKNSIKSAEDSINKMKQMNKEAEESIKSYKSFINNRKDNSRKNELSIINNSKQSSNKKSKPRSDRDMYWIKNIRNYGPQLYVNDSNYNEIPDDYKKWYKRDEKGNYKYNWDLHYGI